MTDLGVALTWIAISAASVKGLSIFARASLTSESDEESASLVLDGALARSRTRKQDGPSARP
jgi:hypothetical protein